MGANGTKPHIYTADPAIDLADEEKRAEIVAEVNAGKKAITDLPVKDGRRLVVWQVRSLTCRGYADLARIAHSETLNALAKDKMSGLLGRSLVPEQLDAARRGIVSVSGAPDELAIVTEKAPGDQVVLSAATMDAIMGAFGGRALVELGQRVLELSEVGPT